MKQLTLTFTKNSGQAVIKTEKTFAVNDDQSFNATPMRAEFDKFLAVLTADGDVDEETPPAAKTADPE